MGALGAVCSDKGPPGSLTGWRGHHRVITGATLTVRGARRLLIQLLLPAVRDPRWTSAGGTGEGQFRDSVWTFTGRAWAGDWSQLTALPAFP